MAVGVPAHRGGKCCYPQAPDTGFPRRLWQVREVASVTQAEKKTRVEKTNSAKDAHKGQKLPWSPGGSRATFFHCSP